VGLLEATYMLAKVKLPPCPSPHTLPSQNPTLAIDFVVVVWFYNPNERIIEISNTLWYDPDERIIEITNSMSNHHWQQI